MLPPFIIEQIRKREEDEERSRRRQQPHVELPMDRPMPRTPSSVEEEKRGVVIIDL